MADDKPLDLMQLTLAARSGDLRALTTDEHEHVFPTDRAWDSDDENDRYDVVKLKDGRFIIYDPAAVRVLAIRDTWAEALADAQAMANVMDALRKGVKRDV